MMIFRRIAAVFAAVAMVAAPVAAREAFQTPDLGPTASAPEKLPAGAVTPTTGAAHDLTAQDVDAWLDGLLPYSLARGDIAGAVVVVVKDGQVLTQRGYGYADVKKKVRVDPATTLFRPGSISKLFTWTAVMQLVGQGKLDLDADINTYLDFKIPPAYGRPVTLRNLMTHTGGFEETLKDLVQTDPQQMRPLGKALGAWVPHRIYAPGSQAAYSNYGASLAGYIVQRVSGERFEDYVARHIFAPLGMQHSTFDQPLPGRFVPNMSKAYDVASGDPQPYELIELSPAGALAATGADMAQFMIAHLNQGGPLLDPATARQMHSLANSPIPGLPGMALGFYQESANGLNVIGHGGDTSFFHSDLHLYMDKGVGLYMSFNSRGKESAAYPLRTRLFQQFTDRYFPVPERHLPTAKTAHDHGAAMAGHYVSSRQSLSSWGRVLGVLGQTTVALNPDDTITVSILTDAAGNPLKWREVGPWQWHEVGGDGRLNALVKDGAVASFANDELAPIINFLPAPAYMNAGWVIPALLVALAVMLLTVIAWPTVWFVRRHFGQPALLAGRPRMLRLASRGTALLFVAVAILWFSFIMLFNSDLSYLDGRLDVWMRLAQLLAILAIVGAGLSCWNAWLTLRSERGWVVKLWSVAIALSALFLTWFVIAMRLITPGLDY